MARRTDTYGDCTCRTLSVGGLNHVGPLRKRAKGLSIGELLHALRDIKSTLAIWRNRPLSDPYVAKLYAEFDAYSVETYKRQRYSRTYHIAKHGENT